ncbi:MAG: LysM peptidoglycan-binding domain-containing protein [Treponema sp.]|nr:LysM peptidoglycan-binding domain-containing protein [Treponema sp.]
MASSIGIKIANGEFYPIMEENSLIKKRLILTTVHDNQPSVQIDLYRSPQGTMPDAQYIGTVVVENIKPKQKGEPSIEMVISSDKDGNIVADAIDLDTGANGEHYVLTVSLKSLDETSRDMEIPDFELETNEEPPSGLYNQASKVRNEKTGSSNKWLIPLLILLLLLGLLAIWLFFFNGMDTVRPLVDKYTTDKTTEIVSEPVSEPVRQPEPEPTPVQEEPPVMQTEPVQQVVEPPPVIQAPQTPPPPREQTARPASGRNPPVASYNVPATIPREGVNYRIRWGDTLWDIAEAFYRDPWQYPRIARHNNIRNPDLIISGRTIRVPPRN